MKRARLGTGTDQVHDVQLDRVRTYLEDGSLDEPEFRRQLLQSRLTAQGRMFVCAACLKPFMYSEPQPSKTTARKHCRVFHQSILDRIESDSPNDIP